MIPKYLFPLRGSIFKYAKLTMWVLYLVVNIITPIVLIGHIKIQ